MIHVNNKTEVRKIRQIGKELSCARNEIRTHTPKPALPPQSSVSTNFTIRAFISNGVPRTGLEPARPQSHSHLKRARLPIPPPGQSLHK